MAYQRNRVITERNSWASGILKLDELLYIILCCVLFYVHSSSTPLVTLTSGYWLALRGGYDILGFGMV